MCRQGLITNLINRQRRRKIYRIILAERAATEEGSIVISESAAEVRSSKGLRHRAPSGQPSYQRLSPPRMFRKRKDVFVLPDTKRPETAGASAVTLLRVGPSLDRSPVRRPWYAGGRHGIPGFTFHRKSPQAAWRLSRGLRARCSRDSGVEVAASGPPSPRSPAAAAEPAASTDRSGPPGDGGPGAEASDPAGERRPSARSTSRRKSSGERRRGHGSGERRGPELADGTGVRQATGRSREQNASRESGAVGASRVAGASSDGQPKLGDPHVARARRGEEGERRAGAETERPPNGKGPDRVDGDQRRAQAKSGAAAGVGTGLCHLDQLCRLMEKMGHLKVTNKKLEQQVLQLQNDLEAQRSQQGLLLSACRCGTRAWVRQHWLSLAQAPGGGAGARLRSHSDVVVEALGAVHRHRLPTLGDADAPRRSGSVNTHAHAALDEPEPGSAAAAAKRHLHVLNSLP